VLILSGLEGKLKKVPGIAEVTVNYAADIVQVRFDPKKVTSDDIRTFMKKLGQPTVRRT
jgi:copper chaperone CopZ